MHRHEKMMGGTSTHKEKCWLSHNTGITSREAEVPKNRWEGTVAINIDVAKRHKPRLRKEPVWPVMLLHRLLWRNQLECVSRSSPLFRLLCVHTSGREMGSCRPQGSPQGNKGSWTLWRLRLGGKGRIKQHIPKKPWLLIIHFLKFCSFSRTLHKVNPTDSCIENKNSSLAPQKLAEKVRRNRRHSLLCFGGGDRSLPMEKNSTVLRKRGGQNKQPHFL